MLSSPRNLREPDPKDHPGSKGADEVEVPPTVGQSNTTAAPGDLKNQSTTAATENHANTTAAASPKSTNITRHVDNGATPDDNAASKQNASVGTTPAPVQHGAQNLTDPPVNTQNDTRETSSSPIRHGVQNLTDPGQDVGKAGESPPDNTTTPSDNATAPVDGKTNGTTTPVSKPTGNVTTTPVSKPIGNVTTTPVKSPTGNATAPVDPPKNNSSTAPVAGSGTGTGTGTGDKNDTKPTPNPTPKPDDDPLTKLPNCSATSYHTNGTLWEVVFTNKTTVWLGRVQSQGGTAGLGDAIGSKGDNDPKIVEIGHDRGIADGGVLLARALILEERVNRRAAPPPFISRYLPFDVLERAEEESAMNDDDHKAAGQYYAFSDCKVWLDDAVMKDNRTAPNFDHYFPSEHKSGDDNDDDSGKNSSTKTGGDDTSKGTTNATQGQDQNQNQNQNQNQTQNQNQDQTQKQNQTQDQVQQPPSQPQQPQQPQQQQPVVPSPTLANNTAKNGEYRSALVFPVSPLSVPSVLFPSPPSLPFPFRPGQLLLALSGAPLRPSCNFRPPLRLSCSVPITK